MENTQVLAPKYYSISGNRRMDTYKSLSISHTCKCSLPCQHWVVLPTGESKSMRGSDIYKIIPKEHPMYKHFDYYQHWERDAPKRRLAYEEMERKSDEAWAIINEKRRLEEEMSNYNKPMEFVQPEFKCRRSSLL
jgi:hypothetical protein